MHFQPRRKSGLIQVNELRARVSPGSEKHTQTKRVWGALVYFAKSVSHMTNAYGEALPTLVRRDGLGKCN